MASKKEEYTSLDAQLSPGEAEKLLQAKSFDDQCVRAADALVQADVLLLMTGAGWGADSGLAVYGDIGKVPAYQERGLEYSDVSQPKWVDKDPALFYGFWGQCFNDYRSTKPHEGFDIIARWRDDKNKAGDGMTAQKIRTLVQEKVSSRQPFDSGETQRLTPYGVEGGPAGAFFTVTSNVDAHWYDFFEAHEIHDCHGNIELWQCSNRDCVSGIWRAPIDYKFTVDKLTMLAPQKKQELAETLTEDQEQLHLDTGDKDVPRIGHTQGKHGRKNLLRNLPASKDTTGWFLEDTFDNWPKCGHCQSLARPAIFMFGDFGWKYDMSQSIRWDLWRETVQELGKELSVCIVEVGCGMNVSTLRSMSEQLVEDLIQKGADAKLVRINPDFPLASDEAIAENTIPIMSKGLAAIKRIDQIYKQTTAK